MIQDKYFSPLGRPTSDQFNCPIRYVCSGADASADFFPPALQVVLKYDVTCLPFGNLTAAGAVDREFGWTVGGRFFFRVSEIPCLCFCAVDRGRTIFAIPRKG